MDEGGDQTYENYNNKLTQAGNDQLKLDRLKDEAEHKFNTVASVTEGKINGLPDGEDKNNLVRKWQQMLNGPADDKTITKVKEIDAEVTAVINKIDRERELPSLKQYIDMLLDGNAIKNNANEFYNNAIKPNSTATGKDVRDVIGQITIELKRLNREAQTYITNKLAGDTSGTKETLIAELNGHVLSQADIKAKKARADEIFNTKKEEVLVFAEKLSEQNKQNTIDKVNGTSDGSVQPAASIERLEQILAQAKTLKQQEDDAQKGPIRSDAQSIVEKFTNSSLSSQWNAKGKEWNRKLRDQNLSLDEIKRIKDEAESTLNKLKAEAITEANSISNSSEKQRILNLINNGSAGNYYDNSAEDYETYKTNAINIVQKERADRETQKANARAMIAKLQGDGYNQDKLTKELDEATTQQQYDAIEERARQVIANKRTQVQGKVTGNPKITRQEERDRLGQRIQDAQTITDLNTIEHDIDNYSYVGDPIRDAKEEAINRMKQKGESTVAGAPSSSSSSSSSIYKLTQEQIETFSARVRNATSVDEVNRIEKEYIETTFFDTRRIVTLKQQIGQYVTPKVANDSDKFVAWYNYFKNTLENETSIKQLGRNFVQYVNDNAIGGATSENHRQELLKEWHKWAQEPGVEWAKGLVLNSTTLSWDDKYRLIDKLVLIHSLFDFTDWLNEAHKADNNIPSSIPTSSTIRFFDGYNWTEIQ
ncbi:hypothetical protein [Mycoplasma sp. Z386]